MATKVSRATLQPGFIYHFFESLPLLQAGQCLKPTVLLELESSVGKPTVSMWMSTFAPCPLSWRIPLQVTEQSSIEMAGVGALSSHRGEQYKEGEGSADRTWLSRYSVCTQGSKPRCVQAKCEISELTWPYSRRWRSPSCDSPCLLPVPAGLPSTGSLPRTQRRQLG